MSRDHLSGWEYPGSILGGVGSWVSLMAGVGVIGAVGSLITPRQYLPFSLLGIPLISVGTASNSN